MFLSFVINETFLLFLYFLCLFFLLQGLKPLENYFYNEAISC